MPRRRYIIKVDGSFHKDKESGIGVVIIDRYKGKHYFSIKTNCKNSFHCERMAILYALYKLKELNINDDIVILSNNRDIVNEFSSKYHSKVKNIAFGWIPRRQNTTAHHLAKNAAKGNIVRTFVPKQILQMIYK
ncbi:ribonuclease H family protein [Geobacillus thermodenitrificans]|uniref:ribonuclease H family protein n=1 Tax=Geobacillus thermodenitrificans TaxID=33940 RepID=UPI003D1C9040